MGAVRKVAQNGRLKLASYLQIASPFGGLFVIRFNELEALKLALRLFRRVRAEGHWKSPEIDDLGIMWFTCAHHASRKRRTLRWRSESRLFSVNYS
jgi:hypothetical protein